MQIADTGVDLVKIEYPGSAKGCRRVAETVKAPWAVLSAGVGFDEFQNVLRVCCDEGGASGFIAGRSIWKEAIGLDGPARQEFLDTVARQRLQTCLDTVAGRARPWTEAVSAMTAVLEARGITKHYGHVEALTDANFDVAAPARWSP